MSVSKILDRLSKKGQVTPSGRNQGSSNNKKGQSLRSDPHMFSVSRPATRVGERVVDPVVARLKAARKAEMEEKERRLREKKGLIAIDGSKRKSIKNSKPIPPRQPLSGGTTKSAKKGAGRAQRGVGSRPSSSQSANERPNKSAQNENKPKMTFTQLMAKASAIDTSKLSIALKQKTRSPEGTPPLSKGRLPEQKNIPKSKAAITRTSQHIPDKKARSISDPRTTVSSSKSSSSRPVVQARAPLPTRKPSSALQAKLKQKPISRNNSTSKHNGRAAVDEEDDMESDMDSFIASEDEEELQNEPEYDRDEIWSIFNRGKKRSHYSYDDDESDDMEATGAEIFEEESRSKRNALLEDKREMEKEAKLAAMKKARKLQKR